MFYLSHLFETNDFRTNVDPVELADLYACLDTAPADVSPEFKEFAAEVLHGTNFILPSTDVSEALRLYIYLVQKIEQYT